MANPTYGHYVLGLRDVKVTKYDGAAQEGLGVVVGRLPKRV